MAARILAAVAGVASLLAAVLLVVAGDDPQRVGVAELTPTAGPTAAVSEAPADRSGAPPRPVGDLATAPTPSPTPSPTPAPTPVVEVGTRSARIGDLPSAKVVRPVRLRLPSLDIDVQITRVGVADDGQMQVPVDVDDAGWYRHGPAPGAPGNAVIAGHVDDREQGLGAFHRLVDLGVGDSVEVVADDGTTSTWKVTGRTLVDKSALETRDLFRRSGPPQLVLVTCGGEFDGTVRSYRSNVVVVAQPV